MDFCNESRVENGFDWQNRSPVEFLEFLKTVEGPCFVVCGLHCGWITESDRAELAQLTSSKESCASVAHSLSSYHPPRSTVGLEAMFLLQGYSAGCYPP